MRCNAQAPKTLKASTIITVLRRARRGSFEDTSASGALSRFRERMDADAWDTRRCSTELPLNGSVVEHLCSKLDERVATRVAKMADCGQEERGTQFVRQALAIAGAFDE